MILEIIDTNRIKYSAASWIKDHAAMQLEEKDGWFLQNYMYTAL
jgi:hypothetical protein